MLKLFTVSVLLFLFTACKNNGCDSVPSKFNSYEEAEKIIESAEFYFSEKIETPESSWIYGAAFYSCNGTMGFLRINTDHNDYFHQNVPISVWEEFKSSDSKGQFYNEELRGNYQLKL